MTIWCAIILAASIAMPVAGGKPSASEPPPHPPKQQAPVVGTAPIVRGQATWYATGPGRGDAAAGPALRRALGKRWRGSLVHVCAKGRCVQVRLSDWCACSGKRVIDLSDEDFKRLAPLSTGVIKVEVSR
jgi:hypothetical protein